MPWALTQHHPLDTGGVIDEAKKRGISIDLPTLRELYRRRLLIPFVELTFRPVRAPFVPAEPDPVPTTSRLIDLRQARDTGCLRDLAAEPYRPNVPFERGNRQTPGWWNGLLYSWYQLLMLPELEDLLADRTTHKRGERRIARLPAPDAALLQMAERYRRMAIALTALETRYLPNLDPEWIHLKNVHDVDDWEAYRARFDPDRMQTWLQYPTAQVRDDAEWLLSRAHDRDPVGSDWSKLMRRAPAKSRRYLKDASLMAMEERIAAEILLRFYEDLADRGQTAPLPDSSAFNSWHPLVERLSYRPRTLDEDLIELGISPHPRVVLALEGETEMAHAPRVWRALEFADAPELMRLLKLGSVDRELVKVAALTAAPLVSEKVPGTDDWNLIKPYTCLVVAVDPEGRYKSPANVADERAKILAEIKDVLKAQGVTRPDEAELNELVDIRTWNAKCYEFAHFTDDELADGIMAVHHTIDGWSRAELVAALGWWRGRGDIKGVWGGGRWDAQAKRMTGKWGYQVSKVALADALWPTLEKKIERARADAKAPVPPIAQVINDAYHVAQQWRYPSFILTEASDTAAASAGS